MLQTQPAAPVQDKGLIYSPHTIGVGEGKVVPQGLGFTLELGKFFGTAGEGLVHHCDNISVAVVVRAAHRTPSDSLVGFSIADLPTDISKAFPSALPGDLELLLFCSNHAALKDYAERLEDHFMRARAKLPGVIKKITPTGASGEFQAISFDKYGNCFCREIWMPSVGE